MSLTCERVHAYVKSVLAFRSFCGLRWQDEIHIGNACVHLRLHDLGFRPSSKEELNSRKAHAYEHLAALVERAYGADCLSSSGANAEPIFTSVSYSGDRVLVSCALLPVGVDVELLSPFDHDGVAAFVLPNEQPRWRSGPERHLDFFRSWTLKEAAAKALGWGFGRDPAQLRVALEPSPMVSISGRGPWPRLEAAEVRLPDGYVGAVCVVSG